MGHHDEILLNLLKLKYKTIFDYLLNTGFKMITPALKH